MSGYVNEATGEMACAKHASFGTPPAIPVWRALDNVTVEDWQDDMRSALEVDSDESDYGILPKDMWIELQSRIRCDTCGKALDGKGARRVTSADFGTGR